MGRQWGRGVLGEALGTVCFLPEGGMASQRGKRHALGWAAIAPPRRQEAPSQCCERPMIFIVTRSLEVLDGGGRGGG